MNKFNLYNIGNIIFIRLSMIGITIIVPVYNLGVYLVPAVKSLSNQTLNKDLYEVIFVNDGSVDDSVSIIKATATCNYRIIDQENGRIGAALNNGIRNARGEYILFIDGDDCLVPDALSKIWDTIQKSSPDIVFYSMVKEMLDGSTNTMKQYNDNECGRVMDAFEYLKTSSLILNCHYTYRRKFIIENNLFFIEKVLHEDSEFILRACSSARRIINIKDVLYRHIERANSITNTYSKNRLCDLTKMVGIMLLNSISKKELPIARYLFFYTSRCFNSVRKMYSIMSLEDRIECRTQINEMKENVVFVMLHSKSLKYILEGIFLKYFWKFIF